MDVNEDSGPASMRLDPPAWSGSPPEQATADLDELYRAHRLRLTRLAAAITLDRSIAEEVVHDAFIGLQGNWHHVEDPAAYLQRAVVNRSISAVRRRRVMARYVVPQAAITMNPEIDESWAAVCRLPSRERAAIVLRYWLDLSEADMATTLGWPTGTVKSTLHRALKRLRKELLR